MSAPPWAACQPGPDGEKRLGNPPQNGVKYFASKEVLELAQDEKWLHKITVAIYQHWHNRNARQKECRKVASAAHIGNGQGAVGRSLGDCVASAA